jgi:ABC-type phosphate/phosphonate transport system substrate-binding protein
MRRKLLGAMGMGLLVLLGPSVLAPAADERVKVGLTDTIFPGLKGARLQKAVRPFRSLLEKATEERGEAVQAGDTKALAALLKEGKVQMGVFQGYEYAWAREINPGLEPIVISVPGEKKLHAYLVVRSSSSCKKPADLRKKVLARPSELPAHCKLFLERKCLPESSTPSKFYKKVQRTEDTEEALDNVVNGLAQAALVDGRAWVSYRESKPGAARKLRVLLASEPFPCAVIATQRGRYSADRVKRVRESLVNARRTKRGQQLLEQLRLTGFEPMPADYGKLLDKVARDYPPPWKK